MASSHSMALRVRIYQLTELSIDVLKMERGVYLLNVIDINEANLPVATYRVILD